MKARKAKPQPRFLAPYAQTGQDEGNFEWSTVQDYNATEGAHRKPLQREALYRIAMLPFETTTVTELCRSIGAILDVLENGVDQLSASHAIEHALDGVYQAHKNDGKAA